MNGLLGEMPWKHFRWAETVTLGRRENCLSIHLMAGAQPGASLEPLAVLPNIYRGSSSSLLIVFHGITEQTGRHSHSDCA